MAPFPQPWKRKVDDCQNKAWIWLSKPCSQASFTCAWLLSHNHVRLNLSVRFISHNTVFFSHNKTTSADLSTAETIQRTGHLLPHVLCGSALTTSCVESTSPYSRACFAFASPYDNSRGCPCHRHSTSRVKESTKNDI
jgi:hypothetical protein